VRGSGTETIALPCVCNYRHTGQHVPVVRWRLVVLSQRSEF